MTYLKIPSLLLLIALIGCISCNRSQSLLTTPLSAYHEYVSGITNGTIKRSDPIVITFTNDIVSDEEKGSSVAASLLSFSPSIKGKAIWVSRNTIVFTPATLLDWGTMYKGELKLSKLAKVSDELSVLNFNFRTAEKQFVVHVSGLTIPASGSDINYELKGSIETSDEFQSEEIERVFEAKCNGKSLDINWDHQPKSNLHQFSVSGINRTEKSGSLKLVWNGNKIDANKSKGSETIEIPSITDFVVSSARVINTPDQFVEAVFSDPINRNSDLRGLVSIDDVAVERISIDNNVMKIYPNTKLEGSHVLTLNQAIESSTGKKLKGYSKTELNFGGVKPEVRLLGQGVIVPQSESLYFPFEAVGLSAVDVRITKIFTNNIHSFLQNNSYDGSWNIQQVGRVVKRAKIDLTRKGAKDLNAWNAFKLDLSTLIEIEPGAIYNVEIGFRKAYSLFVCDTEEEVSDEYVAIEDEDDYPDRPYESVFWSHYYNWRNEGNACSQAYYSPYKFVNRNILASNFGIIAKTDKTRKTYIYVTNLLTAKPESGVKISIFDLQNQLLAESTTNSDGMLMVTTARDPFMVIARKDKQVGYLKTHNETALPTSNFDVAGKTVVKGVKGFIYAERDVWRPGDSIYVSFILEDKLKSLPVGHPLTLEIYNPRGQFVSKIVRVRGSNHIYTFYFSTKPDDPTGNWQLKLKAGTIEFNKSIQVETIKPNRLKVELNFDDILLSSQKTNKAKLTSRWLHGIPARNLNARVDVAFSPLTPTFEKYKQFDFSTPYNNFTGNSITIFEGQLSNEGTADVKFDFSPNRETGGFLKASFTTKVFENGGDFSINHFSKPFSPYTDYVGLKIDWSYKNWNKLNSDEDHNIGIATVDENGNPVSLAGVKVKLFALDYRWWYHGNNENLASYAGQTYHKPVFSTTVQTSNGKGEFKLKANEDLWGRHLLLVTSPNGHTCGQVVYFGWSWGRGNQKGDAQMLALVTEKENYKVGDNVTISFPANKEARALITFENGTGIIGQEWVDNLEPFTKYTFKARPEMAPNIYVHVSLIQPHAQTANDLPIRLYGIAPILVEDPETRLQPVLTMPDEVRPLKEFTIRVKEKSRKKMEYTIALVDEGLLDLTNNKTPDPWSSFYAREALGVTTYDLYNYVMGAFGSRLESMFAVGGSNAMADMSKKKADRFKPIVKVLGPFQLAAGKEAVHTIKLPQYVGSVRAMVVAADEGKYGNCEKSVPVREPLMVLATLPRVLSPNETVDLPVTIFAMNNSVKNVKLSIESNDFLKVLGSADTTVVFNAIGEKDVLFKVKSANKTGIAKIRVEATSGAEKTFYEIELDIRMPNLPTVNSQFKMLVPGEKWQPRIAKFGIEGTNHAQLEFSTLPPLNLGHRLKYLISYPHGCVEQTTSAVFPQLYLPKLLDLTPEQQARTTKNIEAGIDKLQRFQTADGGFCYWPGYKNSEQWASSYVGFFLIEAEKAGYLIPATMKRNWLKYMAKETSDFKTDGDYNLFNQAYRLFLLSLAGEPQVSAMNRMRGSTKMDNQTRWLLAGAYALAGMKEAAYQLIDFRKMSPDEPELNCYGSYLRDEGIILQTLLALGEMEHASKLAFQIAEKLSSGEWYSTQTTAYSLVSIATFAAKTGANKEVAASVTINNESTQIQSRGKIKSIEVGFDKSGKAIVSVENKGQGNLFVNLSNEGVKAGLDTTQQQRGLLLVEAYIDNNGNSIKPETIKQGADFFALVKVTNKTGINLTNMALTQMFPAGWEIVNTRVMDGFESNVNSSFDYRDYRDDRVFTYFGLDGHQTKTFVVNLNASYCGEYLLAPVVCEAMYDNAYYARGAGKRVNVIK